MFYLFCLREKIPIFMVNFIAFGGGGWKSKQHIEIEIEIVIVEVKKKKKKISYMIDINNK
jgi:hypothetical protein